MNEYLQLALHQIVSIIVGGVCAYLHSQLKQKKVEIKEQELRSRLGRQADIVMLRNIIRQACKKRIEDGWVALDEKTDILACYDVYEELIKQEGINNGVIDDCISQYRKLPNIPSQD